MAKFELPNLKDEKTVLKTIRLKYATLQKIEKLSKQSNISVNRLLNECIEFALNNFNDKELKENRD